MKLYKAKRKLMVVSYPDNETMKCEYFEKDNIIIVLKTNIINYSIYSLVHQLKINILKNTFCCGFEEI